jgi:hypothetical protein
MKFFKFLKREPRYVKKTLQWCNEERAKKGLDALDRLPLGKRGDGHSCPCGKATGLFVNSSYARDNGYPTKRFAVPSAVGDFVGSFDSGELPQYDEAKA